MSAGLSEHTAAEDRVHAPAAGTAAAAVAAGELTSSLLSKAVLITVLFTNRPDSLLNDFSKPPLSALLISPFTSSPSLSGRLVPKDAVL
ncbi:hypothetical protein FQA47_013757 [Oryzias melastigma]|uniref:Uncharacterized protein n=1 Tax=Oryzias melastigma TaxID=30732 RepID=A0A834FGS4_ORYME|nr:hypothetical protein FQA47_013757 [Oryzias melastigma]